MPSSPSTARSSGCPMLGDLIQKVVGAVQATDLAVRCHNSRLHRWLRSPNTEVPPADVLPHSYRRTTTPYLYSPQQLTDLLQAERGRPAAPAAARHHLGGGDRAARLGSTTTTWTSRGRADGARGGVRPRLALCRCTPSPSAPCGSTRPPGSAVPTPGLGGRS